MRRLLPLLLLLPVTAAAEPSQADLAKLIASTDEIAKTVSNLRTLPVKKTIARGIMNREEITKRLILRLDEDYTPAEIAIEALGLKRLGLLPPDADYRQIEIDVLTEQIAGFYDPEVKQLYIADWIDTGLQRMVMAHEIDHALQDQSFDLMKFIKPNRDNNDEQLAKQALVEGDGVALMIEFMFKEQGLKTDPWSSDAIADAVGAASGIGGGKVFEAAPLFLREALLFPYQAGLKFISASRKTHPWSDIDSMFRQPPISTEQILHPEKYRAGEKPVAVKTPQLAALKGYKRLDSNVIGELMWSVFLRQNGVDPKKAQKAAAGWGGDRVQLWGLGESTKLDDLVLTDFSAWDAEADALEAQEAAGEALGSLTKGGDPLEKTDTYVAYKDAAGHTSFVERKGSSLLLVVGAPADLAAKLRDEAWKKWKAGK